MGVVYRISVDQIIPGAPTGILGGFIQRKLREYVEPERAGTPKGEPIGFSRKKFHAALLGLTNIDLSKQAKHVHVSYGLLRKWRTEEVFCECVIQLVDEFIKGPFVNAAEASFELMCAPSDWTKIVEKEPGVNANSVGERLQLPGFEDGGFYSMALVMDIQDRWLVEMNAAAIIGKKMLRWLSWVRPLEYLIRQAVSSTQIEKTRRVTASYLATLLRRILLHPTNKYRLSVADTIAELIHKVLND